MDRALGPAHATKRDSPPALYTPLYQLPAQPRHATRDSPVRKLLIPPPLAVTRTPKFYLHRFPSRNTFSPRDNRHYRASLALRNRPLHHPSGDPHDHHCRRPADRPPPARRCAPPTRAWRMRWTPSSPTTPSASIRPSSASSTTSVATWAYARCRQSPSPWPAIWPPAPVTAPASPPCAWATSAITKAHEWAGQESPCRDQGVRASLK